MKQLILTLLSVYRKTSFLRRPACRFYPSCSKYMSQAIERFGLIKGMGLGTLRLLRCHPFHDGGVDEVPSIDTPLRHLIIPAHASILNESGEMTTANWKQSWHRFRIARLRSFAKWI
jgi:putative membrane protein insertion efficiency factor